MQTHSLGYPRIGNKRELKKASEKYWSGKISVDELIDTGRTIRTHNWQLQKDAGIDLIPSNDFSFYDQVLDLSLTLGAISGRYQELIDDSSINELDLYFAMARGYQKNGLDITVLELTKWFDTNYHYLVPEFYKNQQLEYFSHKIIEEYVEAEEQGIQTKPVIIGPVSYLLLGKEKEEGFERLDLIDSLLPVYINILKELNSKGAEWVQFDEPFLGLDLNEKAKEAFRHVYAEVAREIPELKLLITTYFEGLKDNLKLATSLPVEALHLDLVCHPEELEEALGIIPEGLSLSLGLVDGRNIWKNNFEDSLKTINQAIERLGRDRLLVAPSSSLLHVPCDLDMETNLNPEIKRWLAFAKQKIDEVVTLKELSAQNPTEASLEELKANQDALKSRETSGFIHNKEVKQRVDSVVESDLSRQHPFGVRKDQQHKALDLPLFPTTTIGSFPQTKEVRR